MGEVLMRWLKAAAVLSTAAVAPRPSAPRPSAYDPGCPVDLDMYLLHDLSSSFDNDKQNVYDQMTPVITSFRDSFWNVRFGFGSFVDKPIDPFGYWSDYCYRTHQNFTTDLDGYLEELAKVEVKSGQDFKESQLWGMVAAMTDPQLTWTEGEHPDALRPPIMRVLVLTTDAWYHEAPDARDLAPDRGFEAHPGDFSADCRRHDYPNIEQVANALLSHKTRVVFLTTDFVNPMYLHLFEELTKYGVEGVVAKIEEDSSDFGERLIETIDSMRCGGSTPEPETTPEPEECVFDVAHIVDNSLSYSSSYDVMKQQMELLAHHLVDYHPGSRIGVTSFVDKPIAPFGWSGYDYCYQCHHGLDADVTEIVKTYDDIWRQGGYDFEENQLDAIIKSVLDPAMGWRDGPAPGQHGAKVKKVALLTTDAWPHVQGHWPEGDFPTATFESDCLTEDYPSVDHLGQALLRAEAGVIFLVPARWVPQYQAITDELIILGVEATLEVLDGKYTNFDAAAEAGLRALGHDCVLHLP